MAFATGENAPSARHRTNTERQKITDKNRDKNADKNKAKNVFVGYQHIGTQSPTTAQNIRPRRPLRAWKQHEGKRTDTPADRG